MNKKQELEVLKLVKDIVKLLDGHSVGIAMTTANALMDLIISEMMENPRSACLKLSRHYLDLSKEYKNG